MMLSKQHIYPCRIEVMKQLELSCCSYKVLGWVSAYLSLQT